MPKLFDLHKLHWEQDDNNDFYNSSRGQMCIRNLILTIFNLSITPIGMNELHKNLHIHLWAMPIARDRWNITSIPSLEQLQLIFATIDISSFTRGPDVNGQQTWTLASRYTED